MFIDECNLRRTKYIAWFQELQIQLDVLLYPHGILSGIVSTTIPCMQSTRASRLRWRMRRLLLLMRLLLLSASPLRPSALRSLQPACNLCRLQLDPGAFVP